MGCGCNKKRTQYEVVTPDNKVVLTSPNKTAADAVAQRYPGATVREKGKAPQVAQPPSQPAGTN